jgi:hypothetical protein
MNALGAGEKAALRDSIHAEGLMINIDSVQQH